jgi:antitoxin (DNA-binding transcriptional repressor) of toxin-antitoxin stability system
MRSVGLKILKNKLSEYVRLAAGGETVLVTDRDRVVAEIVPPQPGRSRDVADANYAELIRKGLVAPATIVGKGPPPRHPIMTLEELLKDLDEARADRDLSR